MITPYVLSLSSGKAQLCVISGSRCLQLGHLSVKGNLKSLWHEVQQVWCVAQDDVVLKVTSTCICGSDLHLFSGYMPGEH